MASEVLRTQLTQAQQPQAAAPGDRRDRGPPLLPARRRRLRGPAARRDQGRARRRRHPGRLDADDAAGDQRLPARQHQGHAQPQVQDRPGQARHRARGQRTQGLDPHPVPQRRSLRDRRTDETAIGVAAASQMFFDKPVQKLDLAQIALLAGLPQAPTDYNPFANPGRARHGGAARCCTRWCNPGYITRAQAQSAQAQALQVVQNDAYQHGQPAVRGRLRRAAAGQERRPARGRPGRAQGLHDDQPRRPGARGAGDRAERGPARRSGGLARVDRPHQRRHPGAAELDQVRHRQGRDHVRLRHPGRSGRPARPSRRSC